MNYQVSSLLEELSLITNKNILFSKEMIEMPLKMLEQRPETGGWNALECIEHLNFYGDFYLPEIRKRIENSKFKPVPVFYPGLLGDYFVKAIEPKQGSKKIKTLKDKDPIGRTLDKTTIEKFISQQHETVQLLEMAKSVDLNSTKTSISLTKLIRLKLGDTFRFTIMHNKRHIEQAKKALSF
jgi:hypothetical protein